MDKPQIIEHISHSVNYTVFTCRWIPSSAKFVSLGNHARGTGAMEIYELSKGKLNCLKKVEKPSPFKCGTFAASSLEERSLATGDFGGNLMVWDLERLDMPVYAAKAHEGIVNAIDGVGGLGVGVGAPELVTGGRDGSVKVWDTRQKDVPVADISPEEGSQARDCWAVAFGNAFSSEERMVAAGYDNGDLKMFDLRTLSVRHSTNVGNGVCGVRFDRKDINMNKLYAVGLEGTVRVYDVRTQHPEHGFACVKEKANKSTVWDIAPLPQNRDVCLTCDGNGGLSLWKYTYPADRAIPAEDGKPRGVAGELSLVNNVTLSTQPISSLDWHMDKEGLLVSAAFDQCVRVAVVTNLKTL